MVNWDEKICLAVEVLLFESTIMDFDEKFGISLESDRSFEEG